MYICLTDTETEESFVVNATIASEILGVETSEVYRMKRYKRMEYKGYRLEYDVKIIKNRPRGKQYQKGQSGFLDAILSKAKRK